MPYRRRMGRLTGTQFRDGIGLAEAGLWALIDSRAGAPDGAGCRAGPDPAGARMV